MNKSTFLKRPLGTYFGLTYLVFFSLLVITGLAMALKAPPVIQYLLPVICSWAPTFAFALLFKRLYPNKKFIDFVKESFKGGIGLKVTGGILLAQVLIVIGAGFAYATAQGLPFESIFHISQISLSLGLLNQLIRGPLGEELGWRSFALRELLKKWSPLKASLILGVVWGFWHFPLWLLSGYMGMDLFYYILCFMLGILSLSIIITFAYGKEKSILVPMIIHFVFNGALSLVQVDILNIFGYLTIFYVAFTAFIILFDSKNMLLKPKITDQLLPD